MDEPDPAPPRDFGTSRVEAFSDGVFAIAITLLVLDLAIGGTGSAWHRLGHAWPDLVAYVVSFLTIGGAWLAHNALTSRLTRTDSIFLRLNLLVLLGVSFLPFPTRLVAASLHDAESERVYVTIYGLTLLGIRVAGYLLDEYARREQLYAPDPRRDAVDDERHHIALVVGGYVVAIALGVALPRVAVGFYAVIGIYLVVPFRAVARLLFRQP